MYRRPEGGRERERATGGEESHLCRYASILELLDKGTLHYHLSLARGGAILTPPRKGAGDGCHSEQASVFPKEPTAAASDAGTRRGRAR